MGKLKSSMKSLQEAITSLKAATGPNCIHQGITESFREEGECSNSSFNYVSSTPSFTSSSSSSLVAPLSKLNEMEDPSSLPKGPISSTRFFFTPRTTKSIMEEARAQMGLLKTPPASDQGEAEERGLWEESITVAVASEDPYRDFKVSMEEMVEAYGIRELARLQELLHCYLRLNERKNHKTIVLAFVGLLIDIAAKDKKDRGCSFSATRASCHA